MSTVPKRRGSQPPLEPEPFRYGWREVPQTNEHGRYLDSVRIPLTLEDVLHPQEGDVILQSEAHQNDCRYLQDACLAQLRHDPRALVLSDSGIYWDDPSLRHHAPDVAVILGVRARRRRARSFHVAQEGVRPALIIEITSPGTRTVDVRTKRRQYFLAQVPSYVIVDAQESDTERNLTLFGYRRGANRYQRLPLSDAGRLWLDVVQLWLGCDEGRVVCYDSQGRRIDDVAEMTDRIEAAEEIAALERQRADTAEQRLHELEVELRRVNDGE